MVNYKEKLIIAMQDFPALYAHARELRLQIQECTEKDFVLGTDSRNNGDA